jgi:hypothetical protein
MGSIIRVVQLEGRGYVRVFFVLKQISRGPSWGFSKNRNEHGIFKYLKKIQGINFIFVLITC